MPGHDEVENRMPSTSSPFRQTSPRYRLANARVPVCLVADPAQLKPDADGLASCDIVIEKERIAAIDARGAANDGLPRFDLDRGIVLPRLVDVHTHIDKGQIWQRAQNPDGTLMGARMAVMADREANWSRDDVAERMDFALRCAFAHGTGAMRTHIDSYPASRRRSRGRCSPKCASSGRAASRCRRCRSIRSIWRSPMSRTSARWWRRSRNTAACSAVSLSRRGAERKDSKRRWTRSSRPRSRTASISISMWTRAIHRTPARSARIADAALRNKFSGQDRRGPLLLARARRRQRARHHHRQGRGGAHRGRLAADVQHVPAGPRRRPHAALARRRAVARARCRGRHRDGRERQHARSVLRLWRPRHAGGLSRGDAHPAFRPFGAAVAEDDRGDARAR